MKNGELTGKQKRFCEEYLVDLNATQAAARAGYSKRTAYSIGEENLKKPGIQRYVRKLTELRSLRTKITADRILVELAGIAFAKEGVKTRDRLKALDMLAKHVDLYNKQNRGYPDARERQTQLEHIMSDEQARKIREEMKARFGRN